MKKSLFFLTSPRVKSSFQESFYRLPVNSIVLINTLSLDLFFPL